VLDVRDMGAPSVLHWGAALGHLDEQDVAEIARANVRPPARNSIGTPIRVAVVPEHSAGWFGRMGLTGSRHGRDWSPAWRVDAVDVAGVSDADCLVELAGGGVQVSMSDPVAGLELLLEVELSAEGVMRSAATVTNRGEDYQLDGLVIMLPVPERATELMDFAGRWSRERAPQRRPFTVGSHLREGRRGRTGADAALLFSAGEQGFGFRRGEIWGVHVAFSGNHVHVAERLSGGEQVIGGGELLLPGEVVLQRNERYRSPWVYGVYGDGLDDQARRLHRHLRARPTHPRRPRPVTLNVWEAVYFDHDLSRLRRLADVAAELGVERYVLDDGWFRGRRDDHAGLGDWVVDEDVWPEGLAPLIGHVQSLGMEFGLWFEPEMVNPDSDAARAHPEWIMQTGERLPLESRHQQVLNLGIPAAYEHVRDQIVDILSHYPIAYIKWDHNRDLLDAGTAPSGEPGVHAQTEAAYRMMDELKRRFPELEIESCSSGGARVDLEVIQRTDRVWASDCIDPHERQQIDRWTAQLLPPELIGSHIASTRSHTTGRVHELSFRAGTAVFSHLGIEWDLIEATGDELRELAAWIDFHKENRGLLHHGDVVRGDGLDPAMQLSGVVAPDRSRALFSLAILDRPVAATFGRVLFPGLDPSRSYRVLHTGPAGETHVRDVVPAWMQDDGIVLPGRVLERTGLQAPISPPDRVWLIRIEEADIQRG
jgi:alpha-galactosidase